jgi:hypothetical protein
MKGYGVDANLSLRIIDSSFKWKAKVFYSYVKSIVTDYLTQGGNLISSNASFDGSYITPMKGNLLYSLLSYPWVGLNKEGKSISKLDGKASEEYMDIMNANVSNLVNSGSSIPTKYGSLAQSFSYKNLNFNFNIIYKFGYYFRRPGFSSSLLFDIRTPIGGLADYPNRWKAPGDETKTNIPAMSYPADNYSDGIYTFSEALVESGNHIRLQTINLDYALTKIKRMKVNAFVNLSNLGILWSANKKRIDPDYLFELPAPKSYTLGLRIGY